MIRYEHSQRGTVVVVSLLAGAGICPSLQALVPAPRLVLLMAAGALVVCALLFSSLTIQITDRALRWHFGPGLIRKQVSLSEVQEAEPSRIKFIYGWGIHLTPGGWLYNVSGFQAVAVRLKSGKRFLLGTDEPERLCQAISRALP
ncbi:MAG: hypothetical protein HY713_06600 [candidate division NC10 bacterium]|nr:hypothetical protein [candidate division NC10 bacterium]